MFVFILGEKKSEVHEVLKLYKKVACNLLQEK